MEVDTVVPRDVSLGTPLGIPQDVAQDIFPGTPHNPPQALQQALQQALPPDIPTINAFSSYAADSPSDALPFYEAEGLLLSLWDRLNELKLEISLLEAQSNPPPPIELPPQPLPNGESKQQEPQHPLPEELLATTLKAAEKECLEARAAYTLKQSAVEDVLVTAPILKAVHSGSEATPTERALLPLINRRDILSIASTNLTTDLQQFRTASTAADREHTAAIQRNRELAPTVIALAREVKAAREVAVAGSEGRGELEEAEEEAREGRRRWRIMKSVVAGVVAGSGVDWAGEGGLRELVVDEGGID